MRQRRTTYFNDARHYYLFVHEPPMRLVDAWGPVDEVAGTGVDTFAYGVARDDGLFYPSRVGRRFGADAGGRFAMAAYWRVWHNMQSLIDRGLDPLRVLVDRAHERGLDFIASLRMGAYPGLADAVSVSQGGRGMALEEVRDFMYRVLEELATGYPVEGIELDFAAAPMGTAHWFPPDEAPRLAPVMTAFVRRVADRARRRAGGACLVGARVYPTRELNERTGLEVERWLEEGLVDYVVPLVYGDMVLDGAMPIDWLVRAAHAVEVSVYAMLQPYSHEGSQPGTVRQYASPAMFRAAAANYWQAGVDGLYTWFLSWPLGQAEHAVLTALSDPEQVRERRQHYFVRRAPAEMRGMDYPAPLPVAIDPAADLGKPFAVPFTVAGDLEDRGDGQSRVAAVELRLGLRELTAADRLELRLNGEPLAGETVRREILDPISPYVGQRLCVDLRRHRPRNGANRLEVVLQSRPQGLVSAVTLEAIEVVVSYAVYPTAAPA
ncbi:MAG: hypothetical protein ABIL09_03575 [Gemmatimonadota bacterium]